MKKIAVSGSTGLIGSRLQELLYHDFEFIPLLQSEVDITHEDEVKKFVEQNDFDLFLHLAAYTDVNGAENNKEIAKKVNVTATQYLYNEVMRKGKQMIYISTDFVFDGTKPPYTELSKPNPLGYYARTKYEGECIVQNNAMIVRLSYPYRSRFEGKKDFVHSIIDALKNGTVLNMVTDMLITPTYIDDLAYGLKHLINHYSPEAYHLVGAQSLSPYDAAMAIAHTFDLDSSLIHKTTYEEFSKGKAPRSRYSQITSVKNNFYTMKTFEEGLKLII